MVHDDQELHTQQQYVIKKTIINICMNKVINFQICFPNLAKTITVLTAKTLQTTLLCNKKLIKNPPKILNEQ